MSFFRGCLISIFPRWKTDAVSPFRPQATVASLSDLEWLMWGEPVENRGCDKEKKTCDRAEKRASKSLVTNGVSIDQAE